MGSDPSHSAPATWGSRCSRRERKRFDVREREMNGVWMKLPPRVAAAAIVALLAGPALSVTTQFLKVGTRDEFQAGTLEGLVVGANGELRLARELKSIVADDVASASIDAIVE